MTTFARKLATAREDAGLSQYALAKKCGVSKQTLSKLELGEHEPSWPTVQKIAAALGVDCTMFQDDQAPRPAPKKPKPRGNK